MDDYDPLGADFISIGRLLSIRRFFLRLYGAKFPVDAFHVVHVNTIVLPVRSDYGDQKVPSVVIITGCLKLLSVVLCWDQNGL